MTTGHTTSEWSKPREVTDLELAFPANALKLMPSREESEAALDAMPRADRKKWIDFQQAWFFNGLPKSTKVSLKDGVDGEKAFRHLGAIQGSFEPKHEHKEAAVAYLASLWFNDVQNYRR